MLRTVAVAVVTVSLTALFVAPGAAAGGPAENDRVGLTGGTSAVVIRADQQTSTLDRELRYLISRAIFGNPAFWRYAVMPDPSIHIEVVQGHVTLTGVVRDHLERLLARSLASQFGALSVRSELKTEAESRVTRAASPS